MISQNAQPGNEYKRDVMGRKKTEKKLRLSEYTSAQLPKGAVLQFVYYEDFNNDGQKEAVVGITRFSPFPPDSAVIFVKEMQDTFDHTWLHFSDQDAPFCGIIDNSAVADIDGDSVPELVVSRVLSHEQDIDILVFDWPEKDINKVWHSGRSFFHGSMELDDIDGDGIDEILIESGTNTGEEVLDLNEAFYHVRDGICYKWDGQGYTPMTNRVRMPYLSFNISVEFLKAISQGDYERAYDMVIMPGFLGINGLDDSSLAAFKSYIGKDVMPYLVRNLSKGKLIPAEPYNTCCKFVGAEDCFTIELVLIKDILRICNLTISKKYS